MIWTIIVALLLGIIIGPLARLVMPGKQDISLVMTIVLGALGALIGAWLVAYLTDMDGFNIWALLAGVGVAVVLVLGYLALTGRNDTSRRVT
ncbi:MAG: GlsB/YeaQ/YmgE family stress response membrane protein [Actinomycetota bacterium]|nr:GlsB/YeaQ/YmgE family stress response membrane protein [Actinomycetota bacterium]